MEESPKYSLKCFVNKTAWKSQDSPLSHGKVREAVEKDLRISEMTLINKEEIIYFNYVLMEHSIDKN